MADRASMIGDARGWSALSSPSVGEHSGEPLVIMKGSAAFGQRPATSLAALRNSPDTTLHSV